MHPSCTISRAFALFWSAMEVKGDHCWHHCLHLAVRITLNYPIKKCPRAMCSVVSINLQCKFWPSNFCSRGWSHRTAPICLLQFKFSYADPSHYPKFKVVDSWKSAIDNGLKFVCAFLDLRKAFDVIRHDVLLSKLEFESHGIKEKVLQWFNRASQKDHSMLM